MRAVLALALLTLAACGPIPLAQAERECLQDARLAEQPRGYVFVGVGSDGKPRLGGEVGVSTDFIAGRDPSDVYNACVKRKSGAFPSRPYYDIPAAP